MNFNLGSMMGMMGGAPVTKAGTVIIEKLKAAKTMEPGEMGGIMDSGLINGLSGILKNPMSGSGGKAKQATTDAQASVGKRDDGQSVGEARSFPLTIVALDDLAEAIEDLMAAAAEAVGIGSDPEGLLGTVAATQVLDSIGQVNSDLSPSAILGPLVADAEMDAVVDALDPIVRDLRSGIVHDAAAASRIDDLTESLVAIVDRATLARLAASEHAVYLSSVAAASALLISGSPEWRAALEKAFLPDSLEAVRAASAELLSVEDEEE